MSVDVLSQALDELTTAKVNVAKTPSPQIRSKEQKLFLRAVAFAWFKTHRPAVALSAQPEFLSAADDSYRIILDAAEKNSAKSTYLDAIASARKALIALRGVVVLAVGISADDAAPDFSPLAADSVMQSILMRRWEECRKCVVADAPLAGIVMMGGLLGALFVARANKLSDKAALFKASSAPIDAKTKKPLDLRDWTLRPYLDVGHELGWITRSAKDVGAVLRDYRNYVHPEKERSHGVILSSDDCTMLWQITKGFVRQLLASAKTIT